MTNQAIQKSQPKSNLVAIDGGLNSITKMNMRELKELAEVFVTSGAFTDVKSTAQAIVKVLAGAELGFSPIVSMTNIHFFQGKVSIGANLMASLIKDSGKYEYKVLQMDKTACEIAFYQIIGGELVSLGTPVRYTIDEARLAGLAGKDVWKKHPDDMLFAACMRKGCRRYCADVLRGTSTDADTPRDYEIDTQQMENETATNRTVDADPIPQNDTPEAVDMETGEVIEAEAVASDEDSALVDLQEAVRQLLIEKVGPSTDDQKPVLKGRVIEMMTYENLLKLHGDLDAM